MNAEIVSSPASSRRLRILHVVPSYYPAVRYGGPIRCVHGLAAAMTRRGHEVQVYTSSIDGERNLDVPLGEPVLRDGVAVHYFPVPALRRLCWCPGLARHLRQTIAGFDVVHLHSVYLWPTFAAARIAARAGVPYVLSPHGSLVRELIRRKSRWVKSAWIQLVERRSIAQAAALVVNTELEATDLRALSLPARRMLCVANGVEWPETFAPLAAGPFADIPRPYALFLGRINWKKGLERLIEAWQQLPGLHLVIAGNDEEAYLPKLQALVMSAGLEHRVHFVGHADDADKWALFEQAEMFVLPSYSENFGIAVAEAMAMRCAVIVTPEVGMAGLVKKASAGIVAEGDPAAFASAVRRLHADPELRRRMGENGRIAVREQLSWDAIAAQAEAVYRKVSDTAPSGSQPRSSQPHGSLPGDPAIPSSWKPL